MTNELNQTETLSNGDGRPDAAETHGVEMVSLSVENGLATVNKRPPRFTRGGLPGPGRPRASPSLKAALKAVCKPETVKMAFDVLVSIATDESQKGAVRVAASVAILNRALGSPRASVDVFKQTLDLNDVHREHVRAFMASLEGNPAAVRAAFALQDAVLGDGKPTNSTPAIEPERAKND